MYNGPKTFDLPNYLAQSQMLQGQMQQQMQQFNQLNIYNQNSRGKEYMQEVNKIMEKMDKPEVQLLLEEPEFQAAKQVYEAGFMSFLTKRFNDEFLADELGNEAAKQLLDVTKKLADKVNYASKQKQERYDKLLELLDKNPELLKQLETKE